jgi:hypothetical protein
MKKESQKNHILYSSFKKHCYGVQTSRICGARKVLSLEEEDNIILERNPWQWLDAQLETSSS